MGHPINTLRSARGWAGRTLGQGPAWALPPKHQPGIPQTRARDPTCGEGQPLRLCGLVHIPFPGSGGTCCPRSLGLRPVPHSARVTVRRLASPLTSLGLGFPFCKSSWQRRSPGGSDTPGFSAPADGKTRPPRWVCLSIDSARKLCWWAMNLGLAAVQPVAWATPGWT